MRRRIGIIALLGGALLGGALLAMAPISAAWAIEYRLLFNERSIPLDYDFLIPEIQVSEEDARREILCLALNIYHEVRDEDQPAFWAVGALTLNRLRHPGFAKSICGVVFETGKANRTIGKFTWTTRVNPVPSEYKVWLTAQRIAYLLYTDPEVTRPIDEQNYFLSANTDPKPDWYETGTDRKKLGSHIFMRFDKLP